MHEMNPLNFLAVVRDDALSMLCGKQLGSGVSRYVYEYPIEPEKYVVKVENDKSPLFQNMKEVLVWREFERYERIAKWLAPIEFVSHSGKWVLQRRTKPISLAELQKRVKRIPACFTDTKSTNWGLLDGRIVCHDYGTLLLGHDVKETKKAEWWEGY